MIEMFQNFKDGSSEVQREWRALVIQTDRNVELALRQTVKRSLQELSRAINGDAKTEPQVSANSHHQRKQDASERASESGFSARARQSQGQGQGQGLVSRFLIPSPPSPPCFHRPPLRPSSESTSCWRRGAWTTGRP